MPHPSKAVEWFAGVMNKKLEANSHKRGWDQVEIDYVLQRTRQEREELIELLLPYIGKGAESVPDDVAAEAIRECADAANFYMMLAWRFKRGE